MNRRLYTLVLWLLLPWVAFHLLWRGRRQPEYRQHWDERFGRYRPSGDRRPVIWLHAVSVGETRAAQPLVAALRARYPSHRLLLTHMTPTGRTTSEAIFGDAVERVYLAYDYPFAVQRFLDHFRPSIGLIMETELWPNLTAACGERAIPLLLVNGRLSERSARRYRRFSGLAREAMGRLAAIAAQSEADAERMGALGAGNVAVLGNMKFDIAPPTEQLELGADFRQRFGPRPVFLCASTREGEEALILDAWNRAAPADALLVLVPRHPQRFDEVAALVTARGLKLQHRTDDSPVTTTTEVWLGDSMGEMFAYYAASDVAFIGGSLLDFGSQNLIEASSVGTPVLLGSSTYNFADAAREAIACCAALQVENAEQLVKEGLALLADNGRRQAMGKAGREFAARHRGATERTLALIEHTLSQI
ncbi:MAG: 3-deoxy-D-manno-octulosonic acid transferase [Deltaproteobacteria bacterium]|nr:3-deoxy-D-manno-octulosonic acid transferase [Deltaproteobacteria bacterium]